MSPLRILVASPIRQSCDILKEYGISLMNLNTESFQVDFFFVDDNVSDESRLFLKNLTLTLGGIILNTDETITSHNTYIRHQWDGHAISRVGGYRNRILDFARDNEYDQLFFVDSDLLLHPETLRHLVEQDKDIISEIYWSDWSYSGTLCPQVWLYDNYTQYEINKQSPLNAEQIRQRTRVFYDMLKRPGTYKVGGLGGCTLISKKVLNSKVNFSPIYNLSFAGEDRHFCVRAAVKGFELFVDTTYPAYHIYRNLDINGCGAFKKRCSYRESIYIKGLV
jgi:hypothetical protein